MPVIFARVVPSEEDLEASYVDQEHCRAEHVPGRIGCYADRGDGVSGIVVNCFYPREGRKMVCFGIKLDLLFRG